MKPEIFETFGEISPFQMAALLQAEPSCFNGMVRVKKYRITIEEVEEPLEVLEARLMKLWTESGNHHHAQPLRNAAAALGIELPYNKFGSLREKKL